MDTDTTTTATESDQEKAEKEFRQTIINVNKEFLKGCEDEINKSEGCLLVPAIKRYLIQVKKALIKLDLDTNNMETKSLAEIGAFFDDIQCSIVPEEQDLSLTSNAQKRSINCLEEVGEDSEDIASKKLKDGQTLDSPFISLDTAGCNNHGSSSIEMSGTYPGPSTSTNNDFKDVVMSDAATEDKEPFRSDMTKVVEEDAVYNVRCKLYVQSGGVFKEKGVGVLYIKNLFEGMLYQIVVRGDDALKKILLNARIIPNLPILIASPKDLIVIFGTGNTVGGRETYLIRLADEDSTLDLHSRLISLSKNSE